MTHARGGVPPAVADHIRTRLDEAAAELVETLRGEIPEYGDLVGAASTDEPRDTLRAIGAALVEALETGRDVPEHTLAEVEALGATRGTRGLSLEAVGDAILVSLSAGHRLILEAWHAAAPPGTDPAGLTAALDTFNRLGRSLARAYQAGFLQAQQDRFHEKARRSHQAREAFVRRILERPVTDRRAMVERAEALGVREFSAPFTIVAVRQHPARPDNSLFEEAAVCARQLPTPTWQPVTFEDDPTHPAFAVIVVPRCGPAQLSAVRQRLRESVRRLGLTAVYDTAAELEDVRGVFVGLHGSVPVMNACESIVGPVASVDRLLPYLMVSGLPRNRQVALLALTDERPPGPTAPAVSNEYLQTLRAALDHLAPNSSDIARSRHLHRHTVANHIEAIEQATSLDVTEHWLLYAASFLLRDFLDSETPDPAP